MTGRPDEQVIPRRPLNRWAVASLALSLVACVPLGVIFGIVALSKGAEERGRGLAIAGLVLSAIGLVAVPVGILFSVADDTLESAGKLRVSSCLTEYPSSEPQNQLEPADCTQPHVAEVVAILKLRNFGDSGEDRCQAKLNEYAPQASSARLVHVEADTPDSTLWKMGHRTLVCLAMVDPPATGSIKEPDAPVDRWAIVAAAAVASFIVGFATTVGIGTSKRLKDTGRRGRWLVIGTLFTVVLWAVAGLATWRATSDDEGPEFTRAGRCLLTAPSGDSDWRPQDYVGCSRPHRGEIFAEMVMSEYNVTAMTDRCAAALSAYAPSASRDETGDIFVSAPPRWAWETGNHDVECIAVSRPTRTGSIKG